METVLFVSRSVHSVWKRPTDYSFEDFRYVDFEKGVIGIRTREMAAIQEAPLSAEARERFQNVLQEISLESMQQTSEEQYMLGLDLPTARYNLQFATRLSMEVVVYGTTSHLRAIFDNAEFQKLADPILYKTRMAELARFFGKNEATKA